MTDRPDVFNELHAAMLEQQLGDDHPQMNVTTRKAIVEFILFLMNRSYWEGVEQAAAVIANKGTLNG